MFEAKLTNGNILKKIVEAIKDVVTDVNIDVSPSGKPLSQYSLILCRPLIVSYGRIPRRTRESEFINGGI